jgi:hypothetical protein
MLVTLYAVLSCITDSGIIIEPEYLPLLFAITVACVVSALRTYLIPLISVEMATIFPKPLHGAFAVYLSTEPAGTCRVGFFV